MPRIAADAVLIHPKGSYYKRIDGVITPFVSAVDAKPITNDKIVSKLKKAKNSDVLLDMIDYVDRDIEYAHIDYKVDRKETNSCYVFVNCWKDDCINVNLCEDVIVEDGHSTYEESEYEVDIPYDHILEFHYTGDLPCWTPEGSECEDEDEYSD